MEAEKTDHSDKGTDVETGGDAKKNLTEVIEKINNWAPERYSDLIPNKTISDEMISDGMISIKNEIEGDEGGRENSLSSYSESEPVPRNKAAQSFSRSQTFLR